MKCTSCVRIAAVFLLAAGLGGCGDAPSTSTPSSGGSTETGPTAPPAVASPADLGKEAGKVYVDSLRAAAEAMGADADLADVREALQDLREEAIGKLVALGTQREGLDAAGRAAMDAALGRAVSSVDMKVFEAFQSGHKTWAAKDAALGDLIAAFNVITQYANFELLKQQLPAEAERLGIE